MKYFWSKISLSVIWILLTLGGVSYSQQLSDYAGNGEFRGVFKGVAAGKARVSGAKRPFSGWMMEDERGQTSVFAVLESDASVTKVVATPQPYIGKRCVVIWDTVEELLAGQKEPTDLTRIRAVRWDPAPLTTPALESAKSGAAPQLSDPEGVAIESIVRSFFEAVQNKDLAGVTSLLDDSVQYYQTRPMPRSAALADIKADWKKYSDWMGEVSHFQAKDALSCTFELSYTAMEGEKRRAGTLLCEVTLNPKSPNKIKSISAKLIGKAGVEVRPKGGSEQSLSGSLSVRRFRFKRVETDNEDGVMFDIEVSITPTAVSGVWTSSSLTPNPDFPTEKVEFSGQVAGVEKNGDKKVLMSFKGGREPYMFPANQKPYWLLREGAAVGTKILVPAYRVFGRNSEKVLWEFREMFGK